MGIEGIEISKLTGALKDLANAADGNKNNVIENGTEKALFDCYAQTAVKTGQISENDYKAIFGSEIVTNPKTYSKKEIEHKEDYIVTILEEEANQSTDKLLERLTERLGKGVNHPVNVELQNTVKNILNVINETGYNSKDDVDDLYDKVKDKLDLKRKDGFEKDVLKALVKNAEYVQSTKEFEEIKQAYDSLVKQGVDKEQAFKKVKAEYKPKGSYYKEILKDRGIFNQKYSNFEKTYIMPDARVTVREAISESEATKSKKVKKDAKKELEENGDYNKYTKKALGGENNFGEWISGKDSDMKIARKNQARKNLVFDIREEGLTEEEVHDAVDKKSTLGSKMTFGLFFKKKTQLFEALVNSGLIIDKGNGKYDVTPLSQLIGEHVGSNYKLDRQSSEFKALAEKTKTTSALAAATELKNLTDEEAKMLVKMCGYEVEGKNWGKAILGATVGALVNGLGGASAAATNKRYYYDTTITNSNHVEVNINCSEAVRDEIINGWNSSEGQLNLIEGGIQIIVDQKQILPLFWRSSKQILKTALKSAAIGAAFGLLAGLKDEPDKPITSTQFKCTTLEEYAKILDSEAEQKALAPQYKEALMLIAGTFVRDDGSWDCEAYKNFLDHGFPEKGIYGAGSGSVLNREELIGLVQELKNLEEEEVEDEVEVVEENHNYSTHDEEAVEAEYQNVPVIDGRTTSWTKIAGQYDCLVERYGLADAIRMIKIAQGINNGDYSKETMEKLLALSKKGLSHMKNVEGLDYEAYKSALTATYLDAIERDSDGNIIPGTGVKVPVNIADCVRDESQSLKADKAAPAETVVDPTGNASDRVKIKDGEPAKYYARFDGGDIQTFDTMLERDEAVRKFKEKYPNAKVEKWSDEE